MGFLDNIKRSLGYEEDEINPHDTMEGALSNLSDMFNNLVKPKDGSNYQQQQYSQPQYRQEPRQTPNPRPRPEPTPAPAYEDYDDYVIIPEQSFYEIVLIRPKTIDDINYVVDQVIEENNPVILDLSFLEKESAANFKLAGEKIKQMRERYGVQALLLARTEDKDLLIVSPKKVKVVNKG
jgi:SepF-like predicted cell division protein (DUF552 family)